MGSYLLKASDDDLARWRAAAEREGVTFAAFVRAALDRQADPAAIELRTGNDRVIARVTSPPSMFSRDVTPDPRPTPERRSARGR